LRGENDDDEEEDEKRPALAVVRQVEQQERRRVAHAVDADRDSPLDLRGPLEESERIVGERADDGDREEDVDRDEHREGVDEAHADEHVLHRQDHEEGEQEGAVVGAPRVGEGDELAQREERDEAEQKRRAERPRDPGDPEQDGTGPERAQFAREALAQRRLPGGELAQRPPEGDDRDQPEQAEQDDEQ
jgi:hypothetical protein